MAMNHLEYRRPGFLISTDKQYLNLDIIYDFLTHRSYWAAGISREKVACSLTHSLCYGVYDTKNGRQQIGLARVITDISTFAYLSDLFILEAYRGQGLGKWLVHSILQHPDLQTVRRIVLDTADAHDLYAQFGFKPNPNPEKSMIFRPNDPDW